VAWVRDLWGGKLILKGIMDPRDAKMAVDVGADALIVSNHGGRQLDGAPATIEVLPQIVEAVRSHPDGQALEIWLDGGIRSGQDVFRALALGAQGTFIGKAFLHGLGALGAQGVTRVLEIIAQDLDLTLAFCGLTDVKDIDASVIWQK